MEKNVLTLTVELNDTFRRCCGRDPLSPFLASDDSSVGGEQESVGAEQSIDDDKLLGGRDASGSAAAATGNEDE
ncbi:hypothetical protein CLOM_g12636 [Closterium sp. NIES-68]|nr:hypothetical protein CLOM_g12636 [Closterium sp. NIES-68]GJP68588.1 hypothetical protein CLOP_g25268 [Closterium sp. NIES-67]